MRRKIKTGIIKSTTVKRYIKKATGLRSGTTAVTKLIADFDAVLQAVIAEAAALAQAESRNTIMRRHVVAALDKHLTKKDPPWDETAKQVIKHNPTNLGKISKEIRRWIREHEKDDKHWRSVLDLLEQLAPAVPKPAMP